MTNVSDLTGVKEIVELLNSSSDQVGAAGDRVVAEEEASSEEYDYNIPEQDASVRDIINLESSGRTVFCFVKLDEVSLETGDQYMTLSCRVCTS